MSDWVLTHPGPQTDADYQAAVEQLLAQARSMSDRAQRDQDDIERLRAKSAPIQAEIRALLTSMGKPVLRKSK